ncbi:hypothetical protein RI129_000143 [Pyrocoelia pectoralis]|uniref:ISXO2-like transposase domain-containing protein n=1 Tax=Pyrocoelia pectoralis TaxID=417401 RepID=A0AAN7USE2_9COLE
MEIPMHSTVTLTGKSFNTITDWFNMCRERECEVGSVIHSDEWPAYRSLNTLGYRHLTVNHQQNYVDPASGANTQSIERSWLDAKIKILRKMRGVPNQLLQSHLDHYCWKLWRKNGDLFDEFLNDIRTVYR